MVRNRLGREADFSYWQCYEGPDGPIAQLDRVTDFYSVGCRFESCWDRQHFGPFYKAFSQFWLRSSANSVLQDVCGPVQGKSMGYKTLPIAPRNTGATC